MSEEKEPDTFHTAFPNGADWVRADFHLHTRADKEFNYDGDPNQFVNGYVAGLKAAGIRIGVITNHNRSCPLEWCSWQGQHELRDGRADQSASGRPTMGSSATGAMVS